MEEVNTSHPSVVTANSHPKQLWKDTQTAEAAITTRDVPDHFYKTIVRESRYLFSKTRQNFGLYSIDISLRQHDFLRLTTHSEEKSTDKKHGWWFNREMVSPTPYLSGWSWKWRYRSMDRKMFGGKLRWKKLKELNCLQMQDGSIIITVSALMST